MTQEQINAKIAEYVAEVKFIRSALFSLPDELHDPAAMRKVNSKVSRFWKKILQLKQLKDVK